MDNSNFWDWENEDEHRVSSVYKDADAENVKVQNNVSQDNVEQRISSQSNVVSNNIEQDTKEENVVLQVSEETQSNVIYNVSYDVLQNVSDEHPKAVSPEVVTENNFILVDSPQSVAQNITPQAETLYAQTKHQQTDYQQTEHQQTGYQQTEHQQANSQQTDYQQTAYQQANSQQTDYQQTSYQQTNNQQHNFQQIIPVQNMQQNQGTNRKKSKQNKNIDYSADFNPKDISENKVSAMAAYLLGPVGIIIALLIARDSAYTAFHVRQALKITICSVALEIIAAILVLFAMIPLVGIIFKLVLIIISAMWLGVLALRLAAIAQVCDGEAREPAVIGKMNCFH